MRGSLGANFSIGSRSFGECDIGERKYGLLVLSQTDDLTEPRSHRDARGRGWDDAIHLCEDLGPGLLEAERGDESEDWQSVMGRSSPLSGSVTLSDPKERAPVGAPEWATWTL